MPSFPYYKNRKDMRRDGAFFYALQSNPNNKTFYRFAGIKLGTKSIPRTISNHLQWFEPAQFNKTLKLWAMNAED